jgi:hypothetical protein
LVQTLVDLADPRSDPAGVLGHGRQAIGRAHPLEVDRWIFGRPVVLADSWIKGIRVPISSCRRLSVSGSKHWM